MVDIKSLELGRGINHILQETPAFQPHKCRTETAEAVSGGGTLGAHFHHEFWALNLGLY